MSSVSTNMPPIRCSALTKSFMPAGQPGWLIVWPLEYSPPRPKTFRPASVSAQFVTVGSGIER